MSWRTSSIALTLRNIGRKTGLNSFIASYLSTEKYEDKYNTDLLDTIQLGDVIWDVGANVGYYTRKFSEQAGDNGRVLALEPSPTNFERLVSSCMQLDNVTLKQCGLGLEDSILQLQLGVDDLGATSRIVSSKKHNHDTIEVAIQTGASLIEASFSPVPNCIKIDVEGFELEVLQGFGKHLKSLEIHAIGVEIHFNILKQRGIPAAPRQIEDLLNDAGFHVTWTDISHILARR